MNSKNEIQGIIEKSDVLVVGSGGAGCRAALEAHDLGAKVTIVTKGAFGKSGTTAFRVADTAGYNMADGVVDPSDNPKSHFKDIMEAALGMAYEELAWILAREAPSTGLYLENLGIEFEKESTTGRYVEVTGCFATKPRMHILRDHGEKIIRALIPEIRRRQIAIVEQTAISRLLVHEGRCVGAIGINNEGNPVVFHAKTIILAAGGAGQLFKYTLTPKDITGDGYALGVRAGADLVNMEFMQVVLGTMNPTRNQFNTFLWCARPELLSRNGGQLLEKYLPPGISVDQCMEDKSKHFPFSTRDKSRFIEIAVQKEMVQSGADPEKAVFVDLTRITDEVVNKLPGGSPLPKVWPIVRDFYTKRGLPISREQIPVGCFAHAINGGLKINGDGQTTLKGLYAAGEVAGGPHGADRLGGNMLVTCQVFGARAGRAAATEATQVVLTTLPQDMLNQEMHRLIQLKDQKGDIQCGELKAWIQDAMWKGVLVVRREEGLTQTLRAISDYENNVQRVNIQTGNELISLLELENLLEVGGAICIAALHRRESRGSHYREDHPHIDPMWEKRILLRYRDGEIQVIEEPV
jgi:fumarate reductase (CoM/CoB) subunit A